MDCSMQASLSFTISLSLLKFMSIESANYLILCHSLLPSIFPSMRVFSNESTLCVTWPKYWSFSFSISTSPSNEYSGLISFRVDWFDLLVKGPSTSPAPQIESINSSVLSLPMVQLSHPHMTIGKTPIALTIRTFVGKVISLLFNMLSRFVKAFLLREQVSFNFTATTTIHNDFGAQENKVCHYFHFFLIYLP